MGTEAIIDDALSLGDNITANDAGYVQRRRRAVVLLRDVFDEVYTLRPWPRRRTSSRLTVPAGDGRVACPWDFGRVGPYGGLYLVQGGIVCEDPIDDVPEHEIIAARAGGGTTDTPNAYAIFDLEAVGVDAYRDLIQLPYNSVELTLELHYLRKTPRILDAGDPDIDVTQAVTLALSGTTVTATTATAHGFSTDDFVEIAGAAAPEYNGAGIRITVTGSTTFTYTITGSPATPDAGTVAYDVARGDAAVGHIPEEFHNGVLAKGLKAKLRESKGDQRWVQLEADYREAIKALKAERARRQGALVRLPSFFGGR